MTGSQGVLLAAGLTAVAVLGRLLSWWLELRFYRYVYDRGGAEDLVTVLSAGRRSPARQPDGRSATTGAAWT